ncbi:Zinc finger protein 469 [Fukomys damarensis]|uniref:Zinc finger protein ZFPM1 n=1 Tax=Fukomys damarensis TaxID=885580 RepID=A0A091DNJ9_FUKDA|nr:Zinc finger protein 469 [Fukomys damarensis]
MPGKRPSGAPPPATTRGLHPCPGARGLRRPSQPPHEDQPPSSRTAQGTRAAGSRALAGEPPTAQSGQALEVKPQAELLRSLSFRGPLGKGGGPDTPPSRSHPGAKVWLAGRVDSSPLQLYGPGTASPRTTPTLDGTPESRPHKPQDSQAEAHRKPSLPGADALPTPEELRSQRCFQEAPTSFTSSNYTSPSATPGPAWAPPSSPPTLASLPELQANRASSWPPAAEDNFPGANFGVPPTKSEPFPEGSRPSPRGSPFPYPLQAQAPHEDAVGQAYANGALAFPFHQPPGGWTEVAMGTGPAYQLPPTPSPLPCYPSQPGGLEASGDCAHALSPAGAAPLTPRPFPDSLHKSLAKVLPEGTPSGHEGLGSSRAPPNPGSQRHFPGQAYGASKVGSSSGPGDTKLATPRPLPARLPQMWEPTAAAYPEPTLHPPPTPGATFFDSPGQQLCLPQSPTVPWPSALPSPRPSPGHLEVLSQLPFPRGTTEWQEGSRGALGAASQAPRPGETMVALRTSPCQPGSSPGLFPYSAVKDPGAQPLFFGGTQPQASPRGAPGLPLSRVVGVSPSGSPLPSPATNTASSSTCSSLSPLSSSPANPSSEDSQLPAPLGPSGFLLPAPHPQETESPFQPPEPTSTGPAHFPLPSDGLESEGALEFPGSEGHRAGRDGLRSFPQGPVAYTAHHFPLSSASLDQLDVLLTCRQCDRNYSSLAAFLEHRQFCALLLARHGPQEHPAPNATPKAPAPTHPDLLGHSQAIPFLLAGDLQAESKEDTLRTSFLPSLAAPPFPLPTSDLDLEDNAKLDSLITEALNGMQDPSDSPEIDSSFIDVFADEDPPGPRGPSAGQPLSTPAGATQEHHAQPLPPAGEATPQPQTPCPGDRATVPLLGPTPPEAPAHPLGRQPRRGKQLKGFWKELDAARSTEEPRRRGHGPQQPPPHAQDLRTQAKGHMDPDERDPRALFLPEDAGTTRRLRLPPRTDLRKQRARRGSSWSKELIHKIVLQKNKPYRPQAPSRTPRGRGSPGDMDTAEGAQAPDTSLEEQEALAPEPTAVGRPEPLSPSTAALIAGINNLPACDVTGGFKEAHRLGAVVVISPLGRQICPLGWRRCGAGGGAPLPWRPAAECRCPAHLVALYVNPPLAPSPAPAHPTSLGAPEEMEGPGPETRQEEAASPWAGPGFGDHRPGPPQQRPVQNLLSLTVSSHSGSTPLLQVGSRLSDHRAHYGHSMPEELELELRDGQRRVQARLSLAEGLCWGPFHGSIQTRAAPPGLTEPSPALTLLLTDKACWLRTLPQALTEADANSEIYRKGDSLWCRVTRLVPPGEALRVLLTAEPRGTPSHPMKEEPAEPENPAPAPPDIQLLPQQAGMASILATAVINKDVFPCKDCGIWYRSERNLQAHLFYYCASRQGASSPAAAATEDKPKEPYPNERICPFPQCRKSCPSASSLEIHMRSHSGERPFVCLICLSAFTTKANCERHLKVHTDTLSGVCHSCGFISTTRDILYSHLVTSHMVCQPGSKGEIYSPNAAHPAAKLPADTLAGLQQHPGLHGPLASSDLGLAPIPSPGLDKKALVEATNGEAQNGSGSEPSTVPKSVKVEAAEESEAARVPGQGLPAPVAPGGHRYCRLCNIRFSSLSTFIAHKKYYCSSHAAEHVK